MDVDRDTDERKPENSPHALPVKGLSEPGEVTVFVEVGHDVIGLNGDHCLQGRQPSQCTRHHERRCAPDRLLGSVELGGWGGAIHPLAVPQQASSVCHRHESSMPLSLGGLGPRGPVR